MQASTETRGRTIRDAATVIALRRINGTSHVLMGRRAARSAFMPDLFVFPGGAVDPEDAHAPLVAPLPARSAANLSEDRRSAVTPEALAAAAIRETWEETGLIIGRKGKTAPTGCPAPWQDFAAGGQLPDASGLNFAFRAITPPGPSRRFDARFFLIDADRCIANDPDDFRKASGELGELRWLPLPEARSLALPFITRVVLAEVAAAPTRNDRATVPFFDQEGDQEIFRRLSAGA